MVSNKGRIVGEIVAKNVALSAVMLAGEPFPLSRRASASFAPIRPSCYTAATAGFSIREEEI